MTIPETGTRVIEPDPDRDQDPPSAALVPARQPAVITPAADLSTIVAAFEAYQEAKEKLLLPADYQEFRERGEDRRFIKRSGWRKLAIAFAVNFQIVDRKIDRDTAGYPIQAEFMVRATAPNGRFTDAWGACAIDERCCDVGCDKDHRHCAAAKSQPCPPRRHFTKPKHDIPATAETRAKNRAAADLFGMGEVSAEEVGGGISTATRTEKRPPKAGDPVCPVCGSAVYDNRADIKAGKKSEKYPAFKCRNNDCVGNQDGDAPWVTWDTRHFEKAAAEDETPADARNWNWVGIELAKRLGGDLDEVRILLSELVPLIAREMPREGSYLTLASDEAEKLVATAVVRLEARSRSVDVTTWLDELKLTEPLTRADAERVLSWLSRDEEEE